MSVTDNQKRLLLDLLETLRPHWRNDRNLPSRIATWLVARRAGSRDRRLYRELAYTALRILPWIDAATGDEAVGLIAAEAAGQPATREFRAAFARPDLVAAADRRRLLPAWLADEAPAVWNDPAQFETLLSRAPLWLRSARGDPQRMIGEFSERGWTATPSAILPGAWQLPADVPLTDTAAYRRGDVEIQDLGSQLILGAAGIEPGGQWLDACAGAGGKTLQLAQLLGAAGHVTAHDVRAKALQELRTRAIRAGIHQVTTTTESPKGRFDGVLVDAPCSGTGTWRRAPHLKWTTTPHDIARAAELQREILARGAARVRPGGRLIYATCSLCHTENQAVARAFAANHPDFEPEACAPRFGLLEAQPGTVILPAAHDTDGFYFAAFRRTT